MRVKAYRAVLKGQEYLLASEGPEYCLCSEYMLHEPGAWISTQLFCYIFLVWITICKYFFNLDSECSPCILANTKVHVCRLSKSIKNGNKYLNEIQLLIHPAVNMINFTTEPQTLLVETAGSSHFSSASVARCALNHIFSKYFWIIYEFQRGLSLGKCSRALPCTQF